MSTIHKERTYMPLRAVLFDLDGLLINSEVLSQRNCLDVCREMGADIVKVYPASTNGA